MKKIEFIHKYDDHDYFYSLKDEVEPYFNKLFEVHAFLGCATYGTYLYNSREKQNFFIEVFSPGLELSLPEEHFWKMIGSIYSIFEEVIICGTLNAATSFRGIASLSNIQYIRLIRNNNIVFEWKALSD